VGEKRHEVLRVQVDELRIQEMIEKGTDLRSLDPVDYTLEDTLYSG